MKILAIESSCDETAAAVVEGVDFGLKLLSNVVVSQVDIFAAYGGVIPEVAARSHLEAVLPVVHKALQDAGVSKDEIDAIAVTHTPGLMGSLLIGTLTARMLAILWGKPLYAVHHLKSHIYANWLGEANLASETSSSRVSRAHLKNRACDSPNKVSASEAPDTRSPLFPLIALVVSGGHTQIIYMSGHNQFEIIGTTRDDAVGECFDKVAKILGLPYPGGPSIAKCAEGRFKGDGAEVRLAENAEAKPVGATEAGGQKGDPDKYKLPHPKLTGLDFSFSGLKTAVLRAVQAELGFPITTPSYELKKHLTAKQRADFAASFQKVACEILLEKVEQALDERPEVKSVVIAGGVSANQMLREMARERLKGVKVYFPELKFAGDNAAMVGAAAWFEIRNGKEACDPYKLSIAPRTNLA